MDQTQRDINRIIQSYNNTNNIEHDIWSHITSTSDITKIQTIQNTTLRIATGCTLDTNIQHQHDETITLSLHTHTKLHASQIIFYIKKR